MPIITATHNILIVFWGNKAFHVNRLHFSENDIKKWTYVCTNFALAIRVKFTLVWNWNGFIFNRFGPAFLKWTLPILHFEKSLVANTGFNENPCEQNGTQCVDLDETACYEPSHLVLHCLLSVWFWFVGQKGLQILKLSTVINSGENFQQTTFWNLFQETGFDISCNEENLHDLSNSVSWGK